MKGHDKTDSSEETRRQDTAAKNQSSWWDSLSTEEQQKINEQIRHRHERLKPDPHTAVYHDGARIVVQSPSEEGLEDAVAIVKSAATREEAVSRIKEHDEFSVLVWAEVDGE